MTLSRCFGRIVALCALATALLAPALAQAQLVAAVLPTSRSVQVGNTATAFATIINASGSTATNCAIAPATLISATFLFQTTNPSTNALTGTANTPVSINAGGFQTFVIALTPFAPFDSTDVAFYFVCDGMDPAPSLPGINTLLLTASAAGAPDIVALGATTSGDGIVTVPSASGQAAFAVATVNVGAADTITVSADTGGVTLPLTITICQTNPTTGACLAPAAASVTVTIAANATPTFGIFIAGTGNIAPLPGANRVYVRFKSSKGVVVGSTSVAVKTAGYNPPAPPALSFSAATTVTPDGVVGEPYPGFCFCTPTPSIPNGLCGFPNQSNPSGGNPPYHFQLGVSQGFPPIGIILGLNGCLTGTPAVEGTSFFAVCAIDLNGAQKCGPSTMKITKGNSGAPIAMQVFPNQVVTACPPTNAQSTTGTVSPRNLLVGGGQPNPHYTWSGTVPAGTTLNTATGVISGTGAKLTIGNYPFTLTISDGVGHSVQGNFTLNVQNVSPTGICGLPIFGSGSGLIPLHAKTNTYYGATLSVGGGRPPYSWSLVSGALPANVTLDGATGVISGFVTGAAGNYNFTVRVTSGDPTDSPDQGSYTLIVD